MWKDPRLCLLLPLWRQVLPEPVRAVLVLRHPYEVAASLSARDGVPWAWSIALWETYVRRATHDLEGLPVYVLSYADLLADTTRVLDGMIDFATSGGLPVSRPGGGQTDLFLSPDLRHSAYGEADLLASGRGDLLELTRLVAAGAGAHHPFVAPGFAPVSGPTTATLEQLGGLDPDVTLSEALTRPDLTRSPAPPGATTQEIPMTEQQVDDTTSRDAWRTWIATNLMLGSEDADLVAMLGEHGMTPDQCAAEIAAVRTETSFPAGHRIAHQLRKLESVLGVRHDLDSLAPDHGQVAHHPVVTREQFLARYYSANKPVLLEGLVDDWPALTRWNPEYLAQVVPEAPIEVMVDRLSDPDYEINSNNHKSSMRMADYVEAVVAAGTSNDIYMVANNHVLDIPELAPLWADFHAPDIYLDPQTIAGQVFFWFGPRGTVTPLHHDIINVLFVQVYGSKRIVLYSPLETPHLYNETAVYSSVDALAPDLETYPRFADATRLEVTVGPGQALFIPVGWWHCVESLETSISMSFTNFAWPNSFTWHHPDLRA